MEGENNTTVAREQSVTATTGAGIDSRVLTPAEVLRNQIADLQRKLVAVVATEDFKGHFVNSEGDPHADQFSVDGAFLRAAGGAMEARMRNGNFPNWHTTPSADIGARAKSELEAGNFIDAGILALMAHAHQSLAS